MTVPTDHELRTLEAAMTECRKRLAYFRREDDALNADLAEADLNLMLERWERLAA